jgi:hypothetical protein
VLWLPGSSTYPIAFRCPNLNFSLSHFSFLSQTLPIHTWSLTFSLPFSTELLKIKSQAIRAEESDPPVASESASSRIFDRWLRIRTVSLFVRHENFDLNEFSKSLEQYLWKKQKIQRD